VLQAEASTCNTDTTPTQPHRNSNTHPTKNNMTNVVIQQNSRKLLMMDTLMSETCWAHRKCNKIASDIKLVFYSSTITMMHGPINIRLGVVRWLAHKRHEHRTLQIVYTATQQHLPYFIKSFTDFITKQRSPEHFNPILLLICNFNNPVTLPKHKVNTPWSWCWWFWNMQQCLQYIEYWRIKTQLDATYYFLYFL